MSSARGRSQGVEFRRAVEAEVLLLDDLGSPSGSAWVQDTIGSIMTKRYNSGRALMVTTSLTDPAVPLFAQSVQGEGRETETLQERIGGRSRSRLFEMCRIIRMPVLTDDRVCPFGPSDTDMA